MNEARRGFQRGAREDCFALVDWEKFEHLPVDLAAARPFAFAIVAIYSKTISMP